MRKLIVVEPWGERGVRWEVCDPDGETLDAGTADDWLQGMSDMCLRVVAHYTHERQSDPLPPTSPPK
jgi:hypothetical protein